MKRRTRNMLSAGRCGTAALGCADDRGAGHSCGRSCHDRSAKSARRTGRALLLIAAVLMLAGPHPASAQNKDKPGKIRAVMDTEADVQKVWAVHRQPSEGGAAVYHNPIAGRVDGEKLIVDGLPVDVGWYALRIKTASGTVEGWNAHVPRSEYVKQLPLQPKNKRAILEKMAGYFERHYPDRVRVLDMRGNTQNAAVLLTRVRKRGALFPDATPTPEGTWSWRVDRMQYENPSGRTWAPYAPRPYYSIRFKRLPKEQYKRKAVTFARHLGRIRLTSDRPVAKLGEVLIPTPKPGIHAVHPDGSPTQEITVKPKPDEWPKNLKR